MVYLKIKWLFKLESSAAKGTNTKEATDSYEDESDGDVDSMSGIGSEVVEAAPPKKQKKTYKQNYKEQWKTKFGSWCMTHISRHEKSLLHRKNKGTPEIKNFTVTDTQLTRAANAYRVEVTSVMFLHEHNLPLLLMNHLSKFLQAVCPDSQVAKDMQIGKKATLITRDCIAVEAPEVLSRKINNSVAFSIIMDETTAISTEKTLVLVVRFFDSAEEMVNKLNIEFQSEHCKIFTLSTKINSLYKTILRNYLKKGYIGNTSLELIDPKNLRNFIILEEVYFGAYVEAASNNPQNPRQTEIHDFKLRALEFYIELCTQIKNRFSFNDPVLKFCSTFLPENALSGITKSISQSEVFFPTLVKDIQALDNERRLLADCEELKTFEDLEVEQFWYKIFELKNSINELMFPNLSMLVKGLMCLPHSSAAAERQFSQYNLIKKKN
ncbi:unnamed protein product [Psylliodes chrysocephalus]|uniref:HAT C-terminal dimerisation domain-containing protein n=1 Tax=Psylliodes chrysocephalus TaxID=3402493 RepID=A0A9P0CZ81_9CUCU|nr:unnamed protein product [Psylliodes chrysocephala]